MFISKKKRKRKVKRSESSAMEDEFGNEATALITDTNAEESEYLAKEN